MTVSASFRALAAVAAAGLALAAAPVAAQTETERVDRTIPFTAQGTITLKNFSGDVRITGTSDGQVVIKAVRRATRERLDRITLEIEESGSNLTINANKRDDDDDWSDRHNNNVVETEFDIQVPAGSRLDINVFSSNVNVTGVTGEQNVHSFSGTLTLVGVRGPVDAKTFSAGIRVEVDGVSEHDLQLETFSGDIESDLPLTLRSRSRRSLDADLGAGGGRDLRFKTFSGDVTLRR